ncbi:hypothetical protein BU17DRAFT_37967, partial [Hysterangium stoloniferum]
EVEPLQDTVPPRYQIESDESEDEDAYPISRVRREAICCDPNILIEWSGPQERRKSLLVAVNKAGEQWTQGVELGEAKGKISIDNVEIASAWAPSAWADVIVVCIHLRLPLYVMHDVASTILSTFQSTRISLIDSYPVPSYISSSAPTSRPPIRYLRTSKTSQDNVFPAAEPFYPPNIINSPSASFLSIIEHSSDMSGTLVLLPSAHMPSPAPSQFVSHFGPEPQDEWEPSTLAALHENVCSVLGIQSTWKDTRSPGRPFNVKASRRGDIGEGGMYI